MSVYYNEHDPFAVQWLRNLIVEGLIPDGEVDERDIRDVRADDLVGFVQHHFFAGIGGWPCALRLAGWPDDRPVVTGSCPCQPFSSAGRRLGTDDERHLWPAFRWLIAQLRPAIVAGEQVASADGREWLAGVRADLEAMGYAVGAADLPAASVGAPHRRQRLFWMADSSHADRRTRERSAKAGTRTHEQRRGGLAGSGVDGMGDASQPRLERHRRDGDDRDQSGRLDTDSDRPVAASGFWSDYEIVWCDERDARRGFVPRRVESGLPVLVDGVSFRLVDGRSRDDTSRAALLRGIGNAIVPQVAARFIEACMGETA